MIVNRLNINALKFFILSISVLASCDGDSGSAKKGPFSIDQQTVAVYKCPMECEEEKTYDKAGICPVCQMDMEKIEATPFQKKAASKMDSIVLDTAMQKRIPSHP